MSEAFGVGDACHARIIDCAKQTFAPEFGVGGACHARIIGGRAENAVLLELLTDEGVGALITAK